MHCSVGYLCNKKAMTSQLYLFLYFLVFYLLVFVIRSYLLWRATGIRPLTFDGSDDAHGFNGRVFKFISALELLIVLVYSFGGESYEYLLPIWYLEHPYLRLAGWVLLHISLVWIFIAQLQMADSWRIGIDYQHKTELVAHGLFSVSRNPIFLGVLLANLGLFLVIPNAFTLLVNVWAFSVIHTQVRLEEGFLAGSHGAVYVRYCERVRRWM